MLMNRATIIDNKNGNREVGCLKINYVRLFRHSGVELFEIEKFSNWDSTSQRISCQMQSL